MFIRQGRPISGQRIITNGNMLMADKMQESKMHCQMSLSSLDKVTRQIQDAKTSNSPEKMVAELNDAERVLREMREHLAMCNSLVQTMDHASEGI